MWKFTGNQRPSIANIPADGQESVWDYPRPPRLAPDQRLVRVLSGETVVAETNQAIRVLETASPPTFYIPRSDVRMQWLSAGKGQSFCEWKGQATYWSLETAAHNIRNVGWSYDQPSTTFADISGYLSFYPALLECYVERERVRPQPGGFYGGWVTDEIVGPFKGEPGTGGW